MLNKGTLLRTLSLTLLISPLFTITAPGGQRKKNKKNYPYNTLEVKGSPSSSEIEKREIKPNNGTENKPSFVSGRFYDEINKSMFKKILSWESRQVRKLTQNVINTFNNDKASDKILGTGDQKENSALFSEAIKSHINHQELDQAKVCVEFAQKNNVRLSPEAIEAAGKFFLECKKTLEKEHATLAPHVAKDQNIQQQKAALATALACLGLQDKES